MTPRIARWLPAALVSAALVAAVTAVIAQLEPRIPALGLGVLYLLVVVPVALVYGAAVATAVSLASMAAFSYFCLPPHYSFDPGSPERWSGIVAILVSSLVVGQLAARSQREARRSARLADEQAALGRVATLVARAVPPREVFAAVAREVGLLLGVDATRLARYEPDGTATVVAAWSRAGDQAHAVGTRVDRLGQNAAGSVSAPIVVDEGLWGVMVASSNGDGSFPRDAEPRIAGFTELSATAIANAASRAGIARLAEEQAALRRVATLVAGGAAPDELFAAVVEEVGRVLPVEHMGLARYEPGGMMTTVAISPSLAEAFPVGRRWPLGGKNVSTIVFETGRSARLDSYDEASGDLGVAMRRRGLSSSVGAPIVVEGRVWGVLTTTSMAAPLPSEIEARLASFAELVATAISNTDARTEVAASRARIVAAADAERRRVVRDLHDGAQQRLINTIITLKLAQATAPKDRNVPALLTEALDHAEQANVELRELAHGILPTVLAKGGLRAGVDALASRTPVPVDVDVSVGRLPTVVEATAYFVVAEALTNIAKHARAQHVEVTARITDATLGVQVHDDGVGGARPDGTGLVGLADRLAALDGGLHVDSPAGGGTVVAASIPLPG